MLKDFLKELFGLVFHGLAFERIFWTLLLVVGLFVGYRTWKAHQDKGSETPDMSFRVIMAVVFTGAGLFYGGQAWFVGDYPLFFQTPLILHTYGVCIALGFISAIWVAAQEAGRVGLDRARMLDLAFWVLIAAMVGSRIVFMMVEWESYYNRCFAPELVPGLTEPDCMAVVRFWEGGLVFYGGLIGATVAGLVYLRKNKVEVWRYADAAAVGIPIGQLFGRMGCLAAGCCHGKYVPSDRVFGLHWPPNTAAFDVLLSADNIAPADRALFEAGQYVSAHPTQLYSSGAALLIFLFLLWFRTRRSFNGQILAAYIMLYACVRSFIEIFRGDKVRGFIFKASNESISEVLGLPLDEPLILSTSQFISLLMFTAGLSLWIWRRRASKRPPAPPSA